MPLNRGLCRAVSKWCISDQSMESIAKAYIHHFETATRFDYERAWQKKRYPYPTIGLKPIGSVQQ